MRLNASAFVMDYEDMQIAASSDAVTTSSTKENLGDATLKGLEVEMTALITENFSMNVNIGILDDEIDSLLGTLISNTIVIGKDNDLAMTPDYTLSIMAKYERQLTNGGAISLRADYSMKDDYYTRAENMPENLIDDYENLNLNATYYSVDNSWSATLGMRNATDAEYYQSATSFSSFGEVFGQPVRPRTVYATLQYTFGN